MLQEQAIELLIVTDPSNMAWLIGHDGWSSWMHRCVRLALEGDPVRYGRGRDLSGAKRTLLMGTDDTIGYADDHVQSSERHLMDDLADIPRALLLKD